MPASKPPTIGPAQYTYNSQKLFSNIEMLSMNYPVVFPAVHDDGGSKTASRIHTAACVFDLNQRNKSYKVSGRIIVFIRTAAKWPAVMDNPIANGAEPFISFLRESLTA